MLASNYILKGLSTTSYDFHYYMDWKFVQKKSSIEFLPGRETHLGQCRSLLIMSRWILILQQSTKQVTLQSAFTKKYSNEKRKTHLWKKKLVTPNFCKWFTHVYQTLTCNIERKKLELVPCFTFKLAGMTSKCHRGRFHADFIQSTRRTPLRPNRVSKEAEFFKESKFVKLVLYFSVRIE